MFLSCWFRINEDKLLVFLEINLNKPISLYTKISQNKLNASFIYYSGRDKNYHIFVIDE